jgi:hypothetical protein
VEAGGGGERIDPLQVEGQVALELGGVVRGLEAGGGQPRPQQRGQVGLPTLAHDPDATVPAW